MGNASKAWAYFTLISEQQIGTPVPLHQQVVSLTSGATHEPHQHNATEDDQKHHPPQQSPYEEPSLLSSAAAAATSGSGGSRRRSSGEQGQNQSAQGQPQEIVFHLRGASSKSGKYYGCVLCGAAYAYECTVDKFGHRSNSTLVKHLRDKHKPEIEGVVVPAISTAAKMQHTGPAMHYNQAMGNEHLGHPQQHPAFLGEGDTGTDFMMDKERDESAFFADVPVDHRPTHTRKSKRRSSSNNGDGSSSKKKRKSHKKDDSVEQVTYPAFEDALLDNNDPHGFPVVPDTASLGSSNPRGRRKKRKNEGRRQFDNQVCKGSSAIDITEDNGYSKDSFLLPVHYRNYVSDVLIPYGAIQDRIEKLASDILSDYRGKTPLLLCILKGGQRFYSDLAKYMTAFHSYEEGRNYVPFTSEFVRVRSYDGTESTGNVQIEGLDIKSIRNRDVIIVEDIIDTGHTMQKLVPILQEEASSVHVASLLEKKTDRSCGFQGDYIGFKIPDAFVVGYNLDYDGAFRDMAHICIINEAGINNFRSFEESLT